MVTTPPAAVWPRSCRALDYFPDLILAVPAGGPLCSDTDCYPALPLREPLHAAHSARVSTSARDCASGPQTLRVLWLTLLMGVRLSAGASRRHADAGSLARHGYYTPYRCRPSDPPYRSKTFARVAGWRAVCSCQKCRSLHSISTRRPLPSLAGAISSAAVTLLLGVLMPETIGSLSGTRCL